MGEQTRTFKLKEIPKGSRLENYIQKLDETVRNNKSQFMPFLCAMFKDCVSFLENQEIRLPTIVLKFVWSHDEFVTFEKQECQRARESAISKRQCTAFVVGNRFEKRLYIDMDYYLNLLKDHGALTFIGNLAETYFHELLHCAFHTQKSEQEVHDMQFPYLEQFFCIKFPKQFKKIKASDYYIERKK
jgi:hypothetical protein